MRRLFLLLVISGVFIAGCCNQQANFATERAQIKEAVNRLFIETDNRNWAAVQNIFTKKVLFDVSSMTGNKPSMVAGKDIVAAWDKGLKELQSIHHQVGNFIIKQTKDGAKVFCYGTAYHYKPVASGKNVRIFVGSYNFHLIRSGKNWKIDKFKFNLKYIAGNKKL